MKGLGMSNENLHFVITVERMNISRYKFKSLCSWADKQDNKWSFQITKTSLIQSTSEILHYSLF